MTAAVRTRGRIPAPGPVLAATALAAVVVLLTAVRPLDVLVVRVPPDADPGTTGGGAAAPLVLPLATADVFEVRYRHSVNGFTVRERFARAEDGGVTVVEHYVDGIGAGIDEVAGETTWESVGGGWSRLEGLARDLGGPLVMRVGGVADHRLLVGCHEIRLLERYPAGTRIALGWERTGPLSWLAARLRLAATPRDGVTCALPGTG